jgi:signal transduction histidine kinase
MRWTRILRLNLTIGLAACLLQVTLSHAGRAQIPYQLAGSMATAFFVGTPIMLVFRSFGTAMYRRRFPINWVLIGASILGCTAAGNLVLNLCLLAIGVAGPGDFWMRFRAHVQFSAILAMIFGVGAIGYHMLRQDLHSATLALRSRQLEQERASKLAVEAQLASLESHIRPHFLFNTLNTISSLIPEDPKLAESLVGKLAALLRLSLDSKQDRGGPIERELKIVNDYLEIERARYGNRLRYEIEVPAELYAAVVPPLSIQTLVENCVKHAVGSRFEGAEIRVAAFARGEWVLVEVSDNGPGFTAEAIRPGHGLDNLQRRLEALFGPAAKLEIANDGGAAVSFRIPQAAIAGRKAG